MVEVGVLLGDVVQNVVFLVTGPVLWLFLYLFAWENPTLARATGFGRLTFWLLLPGSVVGTIANLPFFAVGSDIVAINIGGGIVPLLLSGFLLRRRMAGDPRAFLTFLLCYGGITAECLKWVLLAPFLGYSGAAGMWVDGGIVAIGAGASLALWVLAAGSAQLRSASFALGMSTLALVATFLTTAAIPGTGIISSFPEYLIAPVAVGVLAVVLLPRVTGRPAYEGLAFGYAATTFGVLVGADVLRQPPLYSGSSSAIYSIGGAGFADLLYLSGLIALAAGFLTLYVLHRWRAAPLPPPDPMGTDRPVTATGRLRTALILMVLGRYVPSTQESAAAARHSRESARALAGFPVQSFTGRPWGDLGAPAWVDADATNLDALARRADVGPQEAWRALLTARQLVRLARELSRRRFGSLARRGGAFSLDLLLVTAPAVALWAFLSVSLPGTPNSVLTGASFDAAMFGYAAWAFVYFVLAETLWGTTLGKRMLHLRVRDRGLRPAGPLPVVVRDLPKLIPLSILGVGGAIATLLVLRGSTLGVAVGSGPGVTLPTPILVLAGLVTFVALGLGLCALASAVAITTSGENQRLGDFLAGTWVIQE